MTRSHPCRVLVTGAGSGVGQGILKALRISEIPLAVVCADISPLNAALYRGDEALIIPKVEDAGALNDICGLISANNIHVVLVGSEFELAFFSANKSAIRDRTGAIVVACPPETVAIANDKWLTAEFLRTRGIPHARSSIPTTTMEASASAESIGFPLMVKTRSGTSSRHVHVVKNQEELARAWTETPNPMLQEMLASPRNDLSKEYTCSVFKTASGNILGPFHARRTLRGGSSWHVEVDRFQELDGLLLSIGNALSFEGSLNVQLMMTSRGPVPFELNARFSGTTAVRAHFGFNEPAMAIRSYFWGEEPSAPVIRRGIALRYLEEVFLDGVCASSLKPNLHRGVVHQWF